MFPAVLVAARLDNERDVLPVTLAVLTRAAFPVAVTTNGTDAPLERALAIRDDLLSWSHERSATSKAVNIVRGVGALPESVDHVLLVDADTYVLAPTDPSVEVPAGHWAIVQFARLIRVERGHWLERVVAMEIAVKALSTYPRRATTSNTAYFGGSAAMVRRDILEVHSLDERALVEDIDLSLRCTLAGETVEYQMAPVFVESAPATVAAWLVQRRRWASGWLQLCSRYTGRVVRARLPLATRLAWLRLLLWRRLVVPLAVVAVAVAVPAGASPGQELLGLVALVQCAVSARVILVLRRHSRLVAEAAGEPPARAAVLAAVLAVPYVTALWSVDVWALMAPVRRWRLTPRSVS